VKVDILILNHNGRELLEECLPSICKASAASIYRPKILVVDNVSSDGSHEFIEKNYPDICFKKMKENKVLSSFNEVAQESDADIIILLNNDIKVDENFIDPLVSVFAKDQKSFMASFKTYNFDKTGLDCIWFVPRFRHGVFTAISAHKVGKEDKPGICYTFQSGMAAFNRKKFLEVGGFDDIYLPGRIEDSDLHFRAWKRGYRCYYQPESIVYHKASVSFKKVFNEKEMLALSHRNVFVFTWKNIRDPFLLFKHFVFLIPRFAYAIITFKTEIITGFFRALSMLSQVLRKRKEAKKHNFISDTKLFKLFDGKVIAF